MKTLTFPISRILVLIFSVCILLKQEGLAALRISEFMAANQTVLSDEDGDYSDWIEIHNSGGTPVSLGGYHLTDDATDLTQWTFPAISLGADEQIIVFASNKDRSDPEGELHTNFKLGADGEYLALTAPDGTTVFFSFAIQINTKVACGAWIFALVGRNESYSS